VTPAAILRYFETKQELFTAAMSSRELRFPNALEELVGNASGDPRVVLRAFAEQIVPFLQSVIGSAIAVQMHMRARQTTLVVPFDTAAEEAPPRRALRMISEYFRKAMKGGVIRDADPRALALLFIGQLHSYVLIHSVLNVTPVYPLDRYLDTLIDLWTGGVIVGVADAEENRDRGGRARRGGGRAVVRAQAERAEAAGPVRNGGGANGQRRVPGGRPRSPRARR
jgi:AcrR family transcriptional regulator